MSLDKSLPTSLDDTTWAELREIAAKSNAVVAGLGEPYVWNHTYVAGDKLFCVHDAASPEAIRRHAAEGGFPVDSITEISSMIGPATANA